MAFTLGQAEPLLKYKVSTCISSTFCFSGLVNLTGQKLGKWNPQGNP